MKITTTAQYAIRIILYLALKPGISTIKEIGEAMNISPDYEIKITRTLKEAGFINITRGVKGGITLIKDPKTITLYDIIRAVDPSFCISTSTNDNKYFYGPFIKEKMDLYTCLVNIQSEINKLLKNVSISSLILEKNL
jgi:Rrf2 family nitric oxide-sensitive transcriptional repressor